MDGDLPPSAVVPHDDELSRLRARVAELEAQRAGSHHATDPPATIPAQSNQLVACHSGGVEKGANIFVECFWWHEDRNFDRRCRVGIENFAAICSVLTRFITLWREARTGCGVCELVRRHSRVFQRVNRVDDGASDAGVADEVGPVEVVPLPFELPQREALFVVLPEAFDER